MEPLSDRQSAILRAIVRDYVRNGEPVGSKQLVGRYRLSFSPATVRSEMARLSDIGYLVQPHTSAGRIPTDVGYRFFVDTMEAAALSQTQARRLDDEMAGEPESLEDLLQRTTDALAGLTHYAAAVLAPRLSPSRLRRLDLVRMGPRTAMVVLIASSGRVEQRMVSLDHEVTPAQLDRAAADLTRDLSDVLLAEAKRRVARKASPPSGDASLYAGIVAAFEQMLAGEDRVFLGGAANLADEQAFGRDTLHRLYEILERQTAVLDLLSEALDRPLTIRIGSEVPIEDMRACSLVMATYAIEGRSVGSLGLIGPTRMDYQRAAAAAAAAARNLAGKLRAIVG
jgi:heat-inducible transcriptional repressor